MLSESSLTSEDKIVSITGKHRLRDIGRKNNYSRFSQSLSLIGRLDHLRTQELFHRVVEPLPSRAS